MSDSAGDDLWGREPAERDENYKQARQAYIVDRAKKIAERQTAAFTKSLATIFPDSQSTYRAVVRRDSPLARKILNNFFAEIDRFKIRHDMPVTELANECKRAAAWIIVGKEKALWNGLFDHQFSPGFNRKLADDLIKTATAQTIISLSLNELDVSEARIDEETQRLILHNVLKRSDEADFDWLVATMHLLAKAYGRKKKSKSNSDVC